MSLPDNENGSPYEDFRTTLVPGISKLFNNSDHADVKIYLGTYQVPAHSVVLTTQSGYFDAALKSLFSEGLKKEFYFKEGSMHAYWRVLMYMYTGTYMDTAADVLDLEDDEEMVKHVRVYALADRFLMNDLKGLAIRKLETSLEDLWVSESFVNCIREVYLCTIDDESHQKIRSLVSFKAFSGLETLWSIEGFQALIRDGGDFVVDYMALDLDAREKRRAKATASARSSRFKRYRTPERSDRGNDSPT